MMFVLMGASLARSSAHASEVEASPQQQQQTSVVWDTAAFQAAAISAINRPLASTTASPAANFYFYDIINLPSFIIATGYTGSEAIINNDNSLTININEVEAFLGFDVAGCVVNGDINGSTFDEIVFTISAEQKTVVFDVEVFDVAYTINEIGFLPLGTSTAGFYVYPSPAVFLGVNERLSSLSGNVFATRFGDNSSAEGFGYALGVNTAILDFMNGKTVIEPLPAAPSPPSWVNNESLLDDYSSAFYDAYNNMLSAMIIDIGRTNIVLNDWLLNYSGEVAEVGLAVGGTALAVAGIVSVVLAVAFPAFGWLFGIIAGVAIAGGVTMMVASTDSPQGAAIRQWWEDFTTGWGEFWEGVFEFFDGVAAFFNSIFPGLWNILVVAFWVFIIVWVISIIRRR